MNGTAHTQDTSTNLPVVFVKGGEVFANSKDVAAFFDRDHKNVLRDVDRIIYHAGGSDLSSLMFQEVSAFDPAANRVTRSFDMDRDGFALLAMGFTGPKALGFKLAFLRRFREMEDELRRRDSAVAATPAHTDPVIAAALSSVAGSLAALVQLLPRAAAEAPPQAHAETPAGATPAGTGKRKTFPGLGKRPAWTTNDMEQVLLLTGKGLTAKEVGAALKMSPRVVASIRQDPEWARQLMAKYRR